MTSENAIAEPVEFGQKVASDKQIVPTFVTKVTEY